MTKRIIFSLFSFLLLSAYCLGNDEDDVSFGYGYPGAKIETGGLVYSLDETKHEATFVYANSWTGELTIPSEITYNENSYTVRRITNYAFEGCNQLTKVWIPKTIAEIWQKYPETITIYKNPFKGCDLLTTVEVDTANQWLSSVDNVLFSKDTTVLYAYPPALPNKSYSVPESVRTK